MRILFATFASGRDFLRALKRNRRRDETSVAVRTKARYRTGESVVLEIGFPGLPNRVLMRGVAQEAKGRFPGQKFRIPEEELSRCAFLESVAEDPAAASFQRRHRRFPIRVPVRFFVNDGYLRGDAETRDLTPGGVALATCRTLPEDASVTLIIDAGANLSLEFEGRVTWTKREGRDAFVGIRFEKSNSDDMRKLRHLLSGTKRSGRTFEGEPIGDIELHSMAPNALAAPANDDIPTDVQAAEPPTDVREVESLLEAADNAPTEEDEGPTDVKSEPVLTGPLAKVPKPAAVATGTPSAGSPLPEGIDRDEDDGDMVRAVIEMYADEADEEERTYLTLHGQVPRGLEKS